MPLIRRPWQIQPVYARLDRANPLADGITFVMLGSAFTRDLSLDRDASAITGLSAVGSGLFGEGPSFSSGTANGAYFGTRQAVTDRTACTFLGISTVASSTAAGNVGPLFHQGSTASGSTIGLYTNFTSGGSASAGAITFYKRSSGAQNRGATVAGAVDGLWHVHAFSAYGTTSFGYARDGVPQSLTGSDTTVTIFEADHEIVVGNRPGATSRNIATPIPLSVAWNRSLSLDELAAVTANPWQLFEPRRIWVPVSAGGGTEYTITPSGGITFTGDVAFAREKVYLPSGDITYSGSVSFVKEISYVVSGGVEFAGTAPLSLTNGATEYTITPSGGIEFSGATAFVKQRTLSISGGLDFSGEVLFVKEHPYSISGGITFNGSSALQFIPDGAVLTTTYLPLTGVGN